MYFTHTVSFNYIIKVLSLAGFSSGLTATGDHCTINICGSGLVYTYKNSFINLDYGLWGPRTGKDSKI